MTAHLSPAPEPPTGAGTAPAAEIRRSAAGVPGCPFCHGAGMVRVLAVTGGLVIDEDDVAPVPCACVTQPARPRDRRVLAAVAAHVDEQGWPPTLRELADRTGLTRAVAYRSLLRLEAAGFLERDAGKVERGMRLVSR